MASIPFRFVPPDVENLAELKIWEAAAADGAFSLIDTVTEIGAYPDYIDAYTTDNAVNPMDWFAISWVDTGGAETKLSAPLKGGTTTLVAQLIQRVRERDRNVDSNVAQQEAEVVIEDFFGDATDPYDVSLIPQPYKVLSGLTYMTLARALMAQFLVLSNVTQATVGLVSFKTGTAKATLDNIAALIALAEKDLGWGRSLVLRLDRLCHIYGGPDPRIFEALLTVDQEFRFLPYRPWPIEKP